MWRRASIAVLPFTNMSGDPEQEYFSDGISEDIITDLSKIAGLTVIARNSSFTYKGRSVDIRTVGRELGVHSVLEGSIRRAGNRVRITAQLIDATNGAHLWADRYDRDLTDIFAVQDDVTQRIVDALKITLSPAEKATACRQRDARISLPTTAFCAAANSCSARKRTARRSQQAIKYFKEALELDPNYSQAYACLGFGYMFDYQNRWSEDPDKSLHHRQGIRPAGDREGPERTAGATASRRWRRHSKRTSIGRQPRSTLRCRSIRISLWPTTFAARFGPIAGQPLEAIPEIEQAMRLDPALSPQFLHFLGMAYLLAGKYETAAALAAAADHPGAQHGFFPRHSRPPPSAISARSRRRAGCGRSSWRSTRNIRSLPMSAVSPSNDQKTSSASRKA